ncbi:MAG: hypothetical protein R2854_27340 [Caldilineaceae bacterium]
MGCARGEGPGIIFRRDYGGGRLILRRGLVLVTHDGCGRVRRQVKVAVTMDSGVGVGVSVLAASAVAWAAMVAAAETEAAVGVEVPPR